MRVGIIGGGFGLNVQAPIINLHPNMELIAISTMNRHYIPKNLLEMKSKPRHYRNWVEMLNDETLELLFVSSLPIYHFEMVKEAIKRGIEVVCEKPFTMNRHESKELLGLSERFKSKVMIDFEWRYLPIRQKMKKLIRDGLVGDLLHVEYHISSSQYQQLHSTKRGWMGDKQKFGGMLGALGTHMIDCLRWLTQDEVLSLNGLSHTHVPKTLGEIRDADDAFFIHGKLDSGTTFSLQLITGIHHGVGASLKIFGRKGTLHLVNDQQLYLGKANQELKEVPFGQLESVPTSLSDEAKAYYLAFHPFLHKVHQYIQDDNLDDDLPTIEDGHKNQLILDEILGT
ncbi:Gfo/Idh/MocA family oxidoreductase [Alkalicoccobacillus gibsonii]|uniref:Gfo/Idh/MocA family oxidoreductase n=1 Tax=Alkalicoccobacillus gibsonii TaxID=79881 RepID=A0ABU9VDF9_9BACI